LGPTTRIPLSVRQRFRSTLRGFRSTDCRSPSCIPGSPRHSGSDAGQQGNGYVPWPPRSIINWDEAISPSHITDGHAPWPLLAIRFDRKRRALESLRSKRTSESMQAVTAGLGSRTTMNPNPRLSKPRLEEFGRWALVSFRIKKLWTPLITDG